MNAIWYNKNKFHEIRRSGIGGSDIGNIFGIGFASPMRVYAEKLNLLDKEEIEPTESMIMGNKLEPIIVELFEEKNPPLNIECRKTEDKNVLVQSGHYLYHPDGVVIDEHGEDIALFEAKTSRYHKIWDDEIPLSYQYQCQWGMFLTGLPKCYLAVLIQGSNYRQYLLERDEKMIKHIRERVDNFWNNHVLKKIPPDVIGVSDEKFVINALYPQHQEKSISPDSKTMSLINRLLEKRMELNMIQDEKEKIENEIKLFMGDHESIIMEDTKITWKAPKDSLKIDWETIARKLMKLMSATDKKENELLNRYISENSKTIKATRRFNVR